MDWKIELVAIPVSDVDRAKAFSTEKVGFNADHDHRVSDEFASCSSRLQGLPARSRWGPGSRSRSLAPFRVFRWWSRT